MVGTLIDSFPLKCLFRVLITEIIKDYILMLVSKIGLVKVLPTFSPVIIRSL